MTINPRILDWNLNTLIQLVTLFGMIIGGVAIWVDKSRDIEELETWTQAHEQLHRERLAEVKEREGKTAERFRGIEEEIKKIDQLEYRLTVTEQSATTTSQALNRVTEGLSDLKGDIRVVREILQRMEQPAK